MNNNMSNNNSNNSNHTKRPYNRKSSLSSMTCNKDRSDDVSRSIRSVEDDAIETMVVGVVFAPSCDDDRAEEKPDATNSSSTTAQTANNHHEDMDAPTTPTAPTTNITKTAFDNVVRMLALEGEQQEGGEQPDLEAAAVARRSRRRSSTRQSTTNRQHTTMTVPEAALRRESPLPRATKSTRCRSWRLTLLNVTGVVLIVGGIAWASWQYLAAPRYTSVNTGMPSTAVVCNRGDMSSSSADLSTTANSSESLSLSREQQALVGEACQDIEEWRQPCTFAIFYTFTTKDTADNDELSVNNSTNTNTAMTTTTYTGVDTWQFDDPSEHQCHTSLSQKRAEFMALQNFTVHYQEDDPSGNNQYTAPTLSPQTMAAIIASISCGLGILFLCSSLLECVC